MSDRKYLLAQLLLCVPLLACQPSKARDEEGVRPQPSKEDLAKALNVSYAPPAKSRQECIGRLTFNVGGAMTWALSASSNWDHKGQEPVLSWEMRGGDEHLSYGPAIGDVSILIYPGATRAQMEQKYQKTVDAKIYTKQRLAKEIEEEEGRIKRLKSRGPNLNDPNASQESFNNHIAEQEKELEDLRKLHAAVGAEAHDLDFGMPDRKGYSYGRGMDGYVWRDGVFYHFSFTNDSLDTRSDAEREAWFIDFMKRFQPRKLYEISKERGVCIPYGFIPDDGNQPFHASVGFRFDDRPNVLYVMRTQVVDDRPITNTLLEATSRASVGLMPGFENEEVAKLLKKRVGPHRAYIGELAAEQGGAAVRLTEGKRKFDNYSLYTGYMGWMGSQVLPFIAVDMRSFTREQTERSRIERLKTDPPPFEESKARLDALLKSIRLRPTTPAMGELQ